MILPWRWKRSSSTPLFDRAGFEKMVHDSLPSVIDHHVKVRLIIHHVAVHPTTGEEILLVAEQMPLPAPNTSKTEAGQ